MKNKEKSIVLLSSGLDSIINFAKANIETSISLVLTFDYGQQSASWETDNAKKIANRYSLRHKIIELDWVQELGTGLVNGKIPDIETRELDNIEISTQSAKAVWVPNRNGTMINIAAAYADRYEIDKIIVGFNKEEAATFPDNSKEFIDRINKSLEYSTLYHPKVFSYTANMVKSEIVKLGIELNAPYEFLWSCYHGNAKMCGRCESCRRLKRALEQAGFMDEFLKMNRWGFRE